MDEEPIQTPEPEPISITFDQPIDGIASAVVHSIQGNEVYVRCYNVAGQPMMSGNSTVRIPDLSAEPTIEELKQKLTSALESQA